MPIVHVQHAVFVEVPVDLPTSCPHCHAWLEDLSEERNLLILKLVVVQGRTSLVYDTSTLQELLDGYDDTDGDERVVGFSCNRCKEPIISTHFRSWSLEGMMLTEAARLRTLLYDSNVRNPLIQSKVFGKSNYQGEYVPGNIKFEVGIKTSKEP
jgi:hypothetical protein